MKDPNSYVFIKHEGGSKKFVFKTWKKAQRFINKCQRKGIIVQLAY